MSSSALSVSAIIPAYNATRFLREAIDSIRAQDRPVDEIIVVDDGSTDGTAELAESFGADIRVLRHGENRRLPSARNTGIRAATGTVVAFLDADDLWPPDAMTLLLSRLEAPPYPAIVAGRIKVIGGQMPLGGPATVPPGENGFALNFGCSVVHRQAFDDVGLLDPTIRYQGDADWFMRARERLISIAVVDAITLIHRRHEENMTLNADFTLRNSLETLKRSLDRRRAAGMRTPLPRWKTLMHDDR